MLTPEQKLSMRRELNVTMIYLIAGRPYVPWDKLSEISEKVVGVVQLLLFVSCLICLFRLGFQAMSPYERERRKPKHRRHQDPHT
jgi:hypothetical protein